MSSTHPKKIGKYTITNTLGRGAMGMVYEGHDPLIDRTVAIKVINKTGFDDEELQDAMDRFKREAQAAGKLSHANIVMVYEYGEEEDTAFISMEYVAGRTLQEIMASDHLTTQQVQDFMVQLLDGLDYAHTHGVTHRDIKPANLVYTNEGQIKIMDFGIAKIESSSLTQVGTIMGTPAYMAPELFTGEAVDHRTDLFSAAVILYQLLTGVKPFTGDTMSIIMHQVVNVHPPHPSGLNNKLPKILDSLLRKSLSKPLANRFQSASEFKKGIIEAFKKIPAQTKMPRQAVSKPTDQTIVSKKNIPQEPPKKAIPPLYFIIGAVLLLGIGGIFLLSSSNDTPEQEQTNEPQEVEVRQQPTQTTDSTAPDAPKNVKLLRPTSKKITHSTKTTPTTRKPKQSTGISINSGQNDNNNTQRSSGGIRITTPRRD